jgi:hypothetical protein
MKMATSSGTRVAGRRGRSLLERDGGADWVGWDDPVDSLTLEGEGDSDEDRSMTEGDGNTLEKVTLVGGAPSGPAPV